MDEDTVKSIPQLERYAGQQTATPTPTMALKALKLVIRILLDDSKDRQIEMDVSLPISALSETQSTDQRVMYPSVHIRHPTFLSRTAYEELVQSVKSLPQDTSGAEYILKAVDHIGTWAPLQVSIPLDHPLATDNTPTQLERVWFWFPSLSTRSKRKDLVDYAPRYGLTGFVLAGKSTHDTALTIRNEHRLMIAPLQANLACYASKETFKTSTHTCQRLNLNHGPTFLHIRKR
jgi:hypothetical protein